MLDKQTERWLENLRSLLGEDIDFVDDNKDGSTSLQELDLAIEELAGRVTTLAQPKLQNDPPM